MVISAYINHGRIVANCPNCNSAEIVPPGAVFACRSPGCGHIDALDFPADLATIEATLSRRPMVNRNWYPWETAADLAIENAAKGIS